MLEVHVPLDNSDSGNSRCHLIGAPRFQRNCNKKGVTPTCKATPIKRSVMEPCTLTCRETNLYTCHTLS